MPLSTPTISRTPQHIRQVHYRSFERADGLWDIEGELLDTKAIDLPRPNGSGVRKAGDPIHHMRIRVTVDTQLVVQAIEASLEAHPVQGCPGALAGIAGCTHLRELLNNMATAAFQSIVSAFSTTPDQPPAYLGRCTGWDFHGPAVLQYYPQFAGWRLPEGKGPALPPDSAVTNPAAPHG